MEYILHRAETRGFADHGWLKSYHTFSFANYLNPDRIQFGALRVLNDDTVQPGNGFGLHSHDNMEIISIPLSGIQEHKDSNGHSILLKPGDVQVMSAGSGIMHSEYNGDTHQELKFLQIWILPKERDISPSYNQKAFPPEQRINRFQVVVSPQNDTSLPINQDAWISLARIEKGVILSYELFQKTNGIYLFIISGSISANGQDLAEKDGMGIPHADTVELTAGSDAEVLLLEIPML